jgi:actin related protein 2/3 complex subunit 2
VSLFKRHIFAGPFKKVFDAVEGGKNTNPIYIEYRDSESVFIKPEGDRVIVVFSILFKDADDQVIAKTFLQVCTSTTSWGHVFFFFSDWLRCRSLLMPGEH